MLTSRANHTVVAHRGGRAGRRAVWAILPLITALLVLGPVSRRAVAQSPAPPAQSKRPMTFLDMQKMRSAGAPVPNPDGRSMLFTITTPDWKEAKRQSDIYVVSLQ